MRADADIIVTFSEPMDRVLTEIAYDSTDLPPKDVTFSWSAGDRKLTIHPDAALQYGGQTNFPTRVYAYTIGGSARDKAGNQLGEAAALSFTTLVAHSMSLKPAAMHLVHHPPSGDDAVTEACGSPGGVSIGEESLTTGVGLLVDFSTSSLSEIALPEDLLTATLILDGSQPANPLGELVVDRVNEDPPAAQWETPKLESLVVTHTPLPAAMATWEADALNGLLDDLQNRSDGVTQYWVHHAVATNNDSSSQTTGIMCTGIAMGLTYLSE